MSKTRAGQEIIALLLVVGFGAFAVMVTKPAPLNKVKAGTCFYLKDTGLYGEVTGSGLDETGTRIYIVDTSNLYRQYSEYSEQTLKEQARGVGCDGAYVRMALQDKNLEISRLQNQIDNLQQAVDSLIEGRYKQ